LRCQIGEERARRCAGIVRSFCGEIHAVAACSGRAAAVHSPVRARRLVRRRGGARGHRAPCDRPLLHRAVCHTAHSGGSGVCARRARGERRPHPRLRLRRRRRLHAVHPPPPRRGGARLRAARLVPLARGSTPLRAARRRPRAVRAARAPSRAAAHRRGTGGGASLRRRPAPCAHALRVRRAVRTAAAAAAAGRGRRRVRRRGRPGGTGAACPQVRADASLLEASPLRSPSSTLVSRSRSSSPFPFPPLRFLDSSPPAPLIGTSTLPSPP